MTFELNFKGQDFIRQKLGRMAKGLLSTELWGAERRENRVESHQKKGGDLRLSLSWMSTLPTEDEGLDSSEKFRLHSRNNRSHQRVCCCFC